MTHHHNADQNTLCHCLRISQAEVTDCIAVTGAETVRDVAEQTGAGSGCMACHCRIRDLLATRTAADASMAVARV